GLLPACAAGDEGGSDGRSPVRMIPFSCLPFSCPLRPFDSNDTRARKQDQTGKWKTGKWKTGKWEWAMRRNYANVTTRPALRRANAFEATRFHFDCCPHAQLGHRREHCDFQPGKHCAVTLAAVRGAWAAGLDVGRIQRR